MLRAFVAAVLSFAFTRPPRPVPAPMVRGGGGVGLVDARHRAMLGRFEGRLDAVDVDLRALRGRSGPHLDWHAFVGELALAAP